MQHSESLTSISVFPHIELTLAGYEFGDREFLSTLRPLTRTMNTKPKSRSPLVMIADNDEDERCLLKAVMKLKGFKVVEAANGQQAIDLATLATPDLLLIDLRLPRVSGLAVVRQITNQARLRKLKLTTVSLSASGGKRSQVPGSAAHFEKPVELHQLASLIDRLMPTPESELAQA